MDSFLGIKPIVFFATSEFTRSINGKTRSFQEERSRREGEGGEEERQEGKRRTYKPQKLALTRDYYS